MFCKDVKKGAFSHEHIVKFNFKSLYSDNDNDDDDDNNNGKAKANVYPVV